MTKMNNISDVSLSTVEDIENIAFYSISKKPCFCTFKTKYILFLVNAQCDIFSFVMYLGFVIK